MGDNINILVTGGAGFIGSNIVEELIADGQAREKVDHDAARAIGQPEVRQVPREHHLRADLEAELSRRFLVELLRHVDRAHQRLHW